MMRAVKRTGGLLSALAALALLCACGPRQAEEPLASGQQEPDPLPQEEVAIDPFSDEFSILVDGHQLGLGPQKGGFPWGTALEEDQTELWSSDGFDCFRIVCADGTVLTGLQAEGAEDTAEGSLLTIETGNPAYETHRGACIGMELEEVLALYPEAEAREPAEGDSYFYSAEASGVSQIVFWFEEGRLAALTIANGIDGFLY